MQLTQRAKWNTVSFLATIALIFYFGACGWALYAGKLDIKEFAAIVGPTVGSLLGWVGKMLTGNDSQQ